MLMVKEKATHAVQCQLCVGKVQALEDIRLGKEGEQTLEESEQ